MGVADKFRMFKQAFTVIMILKEILGDEQLVGGLRTVVEKLRILAKTTETDIDDKVLDAIAGVLGMDDE